MNANACRVLFVSNGHGEIAIAARIAQELPAGIAADHLALVGVSHAQEARLHEVGPRRAMPSGGLVAMGNVRNIVRDVRCGLLAHTFAQLRFLRGARASYDVAVAVGDVFALIMALQAHASKTVFAGTAKSVHVAPYGAFEQRIVGAASAVFVRDDATAAALRERGIAAQSANVIVDLYGDRGEGAQTSFDPLLAIFPGSRESAYGEAVHLCRVLRALARKRPAIGALLSVAPGLDAGRMSAALAQDGWSVAPGDAPQTPFVLREDGREIVRAWNGPPGAMLAGCAIVLGQAGTANEAAAAEGIPVVAIEHAERPAWYRKRQIGLLGDALLVVRGGDAQAAHEVDRLLDDPARLAHMARIGRDRMGPPGGARRIAAEIERLCG